MQLGGLKWFCLMARYEFIVCIGYLCASRSCDKNCLSALHHIVFILNMGDQIETSIREDSWNLLSMIHFFSNYILYNNQCLIVNCMCGNTIECVFSYQYVEDIIEFVRDSNVVVPFFGNST